MPIDEQEAGIRQRVHAAIEAAPAPDRGRLARIEQGLPVRPARRFAAGALALALALGGGAAAAAAAGYWFATGGDSDNEASEAEPDAAGATPPNESRSGSEGGEPGAPRHEDGPVIYQR